MAKVADNNKSRVQDLDSVVPIMIEPGDHRDSAWDSEKSRAQDHSVVAMIEPGDHRDLAWALRPLSVTLLTFGIDLFKWDRQRSRACVILASFLSFACLVNSTAAAHSFIDDQVLHASFNINSTSSQWNWRIATSANFIRCIGVYLAMVAATFLQGGQLVESLRRIEDCGSLAGQIYTRLRIFCIIGIVVAIIGVITAVNHSPHQPLSLITLELINPPTL